MAFLYKIKWLNGPLAGREFSLPEGETQLGGSEADIALSLEQGVTTVLTASEQGVTLAPAVPVWVEGKAWDTTQLLPPGQVIDLAGQGFVLGMPDAELPLLPVPPRAVVVTASSKRRLSPWWLLPVLAFCLAIAATLWLPRQQEPPTPAFNAVEWLQHTLQAPELTGLAARIDDKGLVHLSGLTASSSAIAGLREQLRQHGLHYYDHSISSDTLIQQVRQVLTLDGYHDVEVRPGDTLDSVEIIGAIQGDQAWLRTSNRLQQIENLKDWKAINDQAALFQLLLAQLQQHGLLEGVSVRIVGRELLINGQLDDRQMGVMQGIVERFNLRDAPRLQARFQNIPTGMKAHLLPAPVVSVGGNKESVYLLLANNMRLQRGAVLPNGYKIYALSHRWLTLVRGEHLISLPIGH